MKWLVILFILMGLAAPTMGKAQCSDSGWHGRRPYGDYCYGSERGWYGAKRGIDSAEEATRILQDYYTDEDVTIGKIVKKENYFEAEILGVLGDGSYALCGIGETVPEMVFGHASKDSLADVWKSNPVLLEIREGLPRSLKGVCGDCVMKNICLGSCIAQNYYRSQDLWAPFWYCEEAQRLGLFPESRLVRRALESRPQHAKGPSWNDRLPDDHVLCAEVVR